MQKPLSVCKTKKSNVWKYITQHIPYKEITLRLMTYYSLCPLQLQLLHYNHPTMHRLEWGANIQNIASNLPYYMAIVEQNMALIHYKVHMVRTFPYTFVL